MKSRFIRRQGRMIATIRYCGAYTERGLFDRAALLDHIPGVTSKDFRRRCCIWHIAEAHR